MKPWMELKAADVMTSPVMMLNADTPIREAAAILSDAEISGAPVVTGGGRPVGVISLFDIVTHIAGLERPSTAPGGFYSYGYPDFGEDDEFERGVREADTDPFEETQVGDIMTTRLIEVTTETSMPEVAKLMWKSHIHRVLVTSNGNVSGVISTMDVLRALTGKPATRRKVAAR